MQFTSILDTDAAGTSSWRPKMVARSRRFHQGVWGVPFACRQSRDSTFQADLQWSAVPRTLRQPVGQLCKFPLASHSPCAAPLTVPGCLVKFGAFLATPRIWFRTQPRIWLVQDIYSGATPNVQRRKSFIQTCKIVDSELFMWHSF